MHPQSHAKQCHTCLFANLLGTSWYVKLFKLAPRHMHHSPASECLSCTIPEVETTWDNGLYPVERSWILPFEDPAGTMASQVLSAPAMLQGYTPCKDSYVPHSCLWNFSNFTDHLRFDHFGLPLNWRRRLPWWSSNITLKMLEVKKCHINAKYHWYHLIIN